MGKTPLTIRRLLLFFTGFYTLAALVVGLGVYALGDAVLDDALTDRIEAESAYLFIAYESGGAPLLTSVLQSRDDRGMNTLGYLLVDRNGRRIAGELRTNPPAPGWADISFIDIDGERYEAHSLTRTLSDGSRLTVAIESAPARHLFNTTIGVLVGGLVVMLIGGVVCMVFLIRIIRGRLAVLNATADAIIAGDTGQRVPESGGDDEFRQLAVTLNRMLDRNSVLIESLRQVSSDIAHDMRTPISRLKHRLERAGAAAANDRDPMPQIQAGIDQADEILALFSALLRIAEVESGALRKYFTDFNLSGTVRMACEIYAAVAEDAGGRLVIDIAPEITVNGDRELVCQALINLIENALRHTGEGPTVTVSLTRACQTATLVVADNGPGVPEHQIATLTSRFTRGSRDRGTPGYGLGLNNVKAIAVAHEAALSIRNLDPGLEVRLDFRLA